ncbi:endonuclease/exonuclease/phosphatase family protein [Egibacter rhizosphaerae]|uniref:endonuclease/exonuclease/phosphatase family protein n=1 Tax=Egibacter rhizosphaerae TaxID=1670831 RepID=UPI0013F149C7|nr:endonuclease/exonuclease/phosphatase family protein [Egibacter rhizosphaerae]
MRLVTYNLLHGLRLDGGGRVDLEAAAQVIAGFDADVVALQEVDRGLSRSDGIDQVAWLADRLVVDGLFAPALLGDPDVQRTTPNLGDPGGPGYGIGLLSRRPLGDVRSLRLPGGGDGRRRRPASPQRPGWDREPRVAVRAVVDGPLGPVAVTTTHLSYLPWRALRQLRHAARLAAAPRAVLLGDLNLPTAPVRRTLPRWHHVSAPATYPAWEPRMQADQILLRGLRALAADVVAETTSDHRALWVEVTPS